MYPTNSIIGVFRAGPSREVSEREQDILLAISTSISVLGTLSNVTSLSYFLTHRSRKLGERLLVLLNVLDLLVCLSATFYLAFANYWRVNQTIKALVQISYLLLLECTGFATSLLTTVRSVVTYHPFYEPNHKVITGSFVLFFTYTWIKGGLAAYYVLVVKGEAGEKFVMVYNSILLISLIISLTVVLTANLLTACKLLGPGNHVIRHVRGHVLCVTRHVRDHVTSAGDHCSTELNRHATITIFILSALFGFFNLLYVAVLLNTVQGRGTVSVLFRNIIATAAVPMNSALNPFVYLFRKREMRRFLYGKCCEKREAIRSSCPDFALNISNGLTIATSSTTDQIYCPTTTSLGSCSADSRGFQETPLGASVVVQNC